MHRKLHIGGKVRADGWEVLNAVPGPFVDHLGNANDLSQFADNTFSTIYASHVVEHFDYKNELTDTLKEWNRALHPGGKVFISVPDLEILAKLFLSKNINADGRFMVMRMMFGGHVDEYDYHVVGLNEEFLTEFLNDSGFVNIKRMNNFDLFDDTSAMLFVGVPISLNLTAEKPNISGSNDSLEYTKIGRNHPCPCGSGKKHKKCHGKNKFSGNKKAGPEGPVLK
ncbi:MAG: methyltransferase domain-containing protein [Desulfobulbaceae bacterium]|nr:methyltransferase domain-containing protein [Desulfobulbaceae bacterium]